MPGRTTTVPRDASARRARRSPRSLAFAAISLFLVRGEPRPALRRVRRRAGLVFVCNMLRIATSILVGLETARARPRRLPRLGRHRVRAPLRPRRVHALPVPAAAEQQAAARRRRPMRAADHHRSSSSPGSWRSARRSSGATRRASSRKARLVRRFAVADADAARRRGTDLVDSGLGRAAPARPRARRQRRTTRRSAGDRARGRPAPVGARRIGSGRRAARRGRARSSSTRATSVDRLRPRVHPPLRHGRPAPARARARSTRRDRRRDRGPAATHEPCRTPAARRGRRTPHPTSTTARSPASSSAGQLPS